MAKAKQNIAPVVKKKVLHVGCGFGKIHPNFQTPEWEEVRLDIDPDVKPDIVASITDMSIVEDNSFDALYSSHNLEHLFAHDVPKALNEFYRVLNEGGIVGITLPDVQRVAYHVAKGKLETPLYTSPAGPISAIDILWGLRTSIAKGQVYMAHRTGFTAWTLANKLKEAGFVKVNVKQDDLNLWARGFKDSKVDKKQDKPNIEEINYEELMIKRDNLETEPQLFEVTGPLKK